MQASSKGAAAMPPRSPIVRRAAALILFASAIAPAAADIPGQPGPADVALVESCLADAAKALADPDGCVGRVSSACAAQATTDPARARCEDRERAVWSAALNRDYERLTALVADAGVKAALRDAERGFVLAKLKTCTFERLARKDSPEALRAASRCDLRATARQDLWIRQQIAALTAAH
jgi:uncharacterized protein YecT (DUF1311 family)